MRYLCTSTLLLVTIIITSAQYQIGLIPRSSPDKGVYQKIGYTEIDINYGSPKVKGRSIWGELLPYDKIWRAGANNATTVSFNNDVLIKGRLLKKGKYALFIIPRANDSWTIIFSNKPNQWGAFNHKKEDEVLWADVKPEVAPFQEELSYHIEQEDLNNAAIVMKWGIIRLALPIQTEYLKILEDEVDVYANKSAENLKWIIYLQAGEHLFNQKMNLNLAKKWLDDSESMSNITGEWNPQFYPKEYMLGHLYWTKAKLYAYQKDYTKAIMFADKMKKEKGDYIFYNEENEFEEIDMNIEKWKSK